LDFGYKLLPSDLKEEEEEEEEELFEERKPKRKKIQHVDLT
jgi:hypothetical protein